MGEVIDEYLALRPALHPNVRRSPYFPATERWGATEYMVYNHMYMPIWYGRDPRLEYEALIGGVCLWDVGAERQTELRGADALAFANYLCTREMRDLDVGSCRYTMICDDGGTIMTEPITLRPWDDAVWISHGDVDLTLWAHGLARAAGFDVEVSEPEVAPMQLQGPRSRELLSGIAPAIEDLSYYHCAVTQVAGQACVVSRTGWSRDLAYELYPLGDDGAVAVWNAIETVGEQYGLLVAGPNLNRAVEQAITDTHYFVNSGMNPYEAGAGRLVDLSSAPFIGAEALVRAREAPVRRHTLGLVLDGAPGRLEQFWDVTDDGGTAGEVRWAAYSFALERDVAIALVDRRVQIGDRVGVDAPEGTLGAIVRELPFVG